jgi:hypothetical protein
MNKEIKRLAIHSPYMLTQAEVEEKFKEEFPSKKVLIDSVHIDSIHADGEDTQTRDTPDVVYTYYIKGGVEEDE